MLRRRLAAGGITLALIGGGSLLAVAVAGSGSHRSAAPRHDPTVPATTAKTTSVAGGVGTIAVPRGLISRLVEQRVGRLPAPLEDPGAAVAGTRVILAGGLTASDTSSSGVLSVGTSSARVIGALPVAQHDAPAVGLGTAAYVFGGGDGVRQLDHILRIDPATGHVAIVGRLPAASSDSAAAAIGGTAYLVGGYTGTRWLDTIVAFRPGAPARVVAHLPTALRYAAVAAAGRLLIVAGGSLPDGSASRTVYAFDPARHSIARIGVLPVATTHAAAAGVGGIAYVIGGRGAVKGSLTAAIVSIDPAHRKIVAAGNLRSPRSDLAAVTVRGAILLAGGAGPGGVTDQLSRLVDRPIRTPATLLGHVAPAGTNVYAADGANQLTGAARTARELVYVPNSESGTLDVIDQRTFKVIGHYPVGELPQHVTPSYDLRTLYVDNDRGNSLTPFDPQTGKPKGPPIAVTDPYNLYFTPNGRFAIVVAEARGRLDFRQATTMRLRHSLAVPCRGVDHMDFSADGTFLLASCEFSGEMVVVDVARQRVVRVIPLPRSGSMPQDVKLSPDGRTFYVADMAHAGIWVISASTLRVDRLIHTGLGAHGLYPSRDARNLYITNRNAGTITVMRFATQKIVATWRIPNGTPDMGGVSADGRTLWLSGRYRAEVYAVDTRTGRLRARIRVGSGPHGLCVWPQPGRYSLGHTGILR